MSVQRHLRQASQWQGYVITYVPLGQRNFSRQHPPDKHLKAGHFKEIRAALDGVPGFAVPAGRPPEIIEYLSATLMTVSEDEEYKKMTSK